MNTKTKHLLPATLAAVITLTSGAALAKATPEEVSRLGKDLTPMGAERAGNSDGSIPEWSGKWLGAPAHVKFDGTGVHHPDPYADEKPLVVITAANMAQHADKLSEGQKALFNKYPDTFKMPIYPSHRDFRYGKWVEDNARLNAENAELTNEGNGVKGAYGTAPFPIPNNGNELLWNHNLHTVAWKEEGTYRMILTYANGKTATEVNKYEFLNLWTDPTGSVEEFAGTQAHYMITTMEPSRKKGEIIVGHEYSDPIAKPRQNWQYIPGTRRVRRAPNVAYDTPFGVGGFRVFDDDRLFNGAPDRYDWKMVGKKEIYIPYHNYKLDDPSVKYSDLLSTNGHLNPEHMRYELHRVWIVEGTLKEGKRHIYGKRVLYIDEDSWGAVMADNYDGRGALWRTNMQASIYAYELQAYHARVAIYHDLIAGSYLTDRLINEGEAPRLNDAEYGEEYFTASNLRKLGRR